MNKTMYLCLMTILSFSFFAAGCETAKGIKQDVQNTGENIQESFDNVMDRGEEKTSPSQPDAQ